MIPLILDHDIGTNPDDFFALLLLLNQKELDLQLTVSGNCFPIQRAKFAYKILELADRLDVQVVAGEEEGCVDFYEDQSIDDVNFQPSTDYLLAIKKIVDQNSEVIYCCIQGMANLAQYLKTFPEDKKKLKIIHMGMNTNNINEEWVAGGTNMTACALGAKFVYESGVNLQVVGGHTTLNDLIRVTPDTALYQKLQSSPLNLHHLLIHCLDSFKQRRGIYPCVHDPLTVSVALGQPFVQFEEILVDFNKDGSYRAGSTTKVLVSKKAFNEKAFMDYLTQALFNAV